MYGTQIVQNQCQLDLLKYAWLKEIYMEVDSKYGNYGVSQPIDQLTIGGGGGIMFKVPLSALVGSGQRKTIAKMELNESIFNREVLISEIKKALIKQYNETIYKKLLVNIRVEAFEVAATNKKLSEKEFKGGLIHIDQYSRVEETYYSQMQLLEQTRMELRTSLSILLEMAGIKSRTL